MFRSGGIGVNVFFFAVIGRPRTRRPDHIAYTFSTALCRESFAYLFVCFMVIRLRASCSSRGGGVDIYSKRMQNRWEV